MTSGLLLRPRLLSAINQALDCVMEAKSPPILLASPPITASPDVKVTCHRGEPLPETTLTKQTQHNQSYFFLQQWKQQRFFSIRFPYLVFLLEGEIDLRLGITQSMAKSLSGPQAYCSHLSLSLRAGQCLLIPPGTPYSGGEQLYWERPHPEQASYKVLLLSILPTGTFCHLWDTQKGQTSYTPTLYVHDSRVHLLVDFLREELENKGDDHRVVARNQLHSVLCCVRREMKIQPPFLILRTDKKWRDESAQQDSKDIFPANSATAVQRACTYIETHLHSVLELESIARHAFVSPTYLNRLFRREMQISVMQYVLQRRLELAQSLLVHSQLPVNEIGKQVGYPNPSHFSQIFLKKTGVTPQSYRVTRLPD
jgi:AraC-like DNA-binding protein